MNYSGATKILNNNNQDTYKLLIIDRVNTGSTYTKFTIASDGLKLEFHSLSDKFQVVRPLTLSMQLISPTTSFFMDFYTANMHQFNVLLYKNSDLVFEGYMEAENYGERYDVEHNYIVQFVANDSTSLLERINWTGTTNLISGFDVLKKCVDNLRYNEIQYLYVGSTTTNQQAALGTEDNIFSVDYLNVFNFYDENGIAMNLLDVLNTVLEPYCCFIMQSAGDLYICDHNAILTGNTIYKKYDIQDNYNFITATTLNTTYGDISGYTDNQLHFDIIPTFNQVVVKDSPFMNPKIVDFQASIENETQTTGRTISSNAQWGSVYNYYTNTNPNITLLKLINTEIQGTGTQNSAENENFLLLTGQTTGQTAAKFNYIYSYPVNYNYSNLSVFPRHWLKLSIRANFRTTDSWLSDSTNTHLHEGKLYIKLKMGDYYYNQPLDWMSTWPNIKGSWTTGDSICVVSFQNNLADTVNNDLSIGDKTITCSEYASKNGKTYQLEGLYIPLYSLSYYDIDAFHVSGQIELQIMNSYKGREYNNDWYQGDDVTGVIKDVWIYGVTLELCDFRKNVIKELDNEKTAYFDPLYKDEMPEKTLLLTDSQRRVATERGSIFNYLHSYLFDYDYWAFSQIHIRKGLNTSLQNLYIRSLLSNYKTASFRLRGEIKNQLLTDFYRYFTNNRDTNFSGKKFMISNAILNIRQNTTEIELTEIRSDDESITEV